MVMDAKLAEALNSVVPEDEKVLGAFVGIRTPRSQVIVLLVLALIVLYLYLGLLGFLLVSILQYFFRRIVTVAVTTNHVLMIENGRYKLPPEGAKILRLPYGSISCISSGLRTPKVTVGAKKMWVDGWNEDEARRLAKLPHGSEA